MKSGSLSMLVVTIILLLCIPSVSSVSSYGLFWGVEEDGHFEYSFFYTDYNNPEYNRTFDFYINVTSLTEIFDNITSESLPYYFCDTNLDFYYSNHTQLGLMADLMPQMILPVGNWSFWDDLILTHDMGEGTLGWHKFLQHAPGTWGYNMTWGRSEFPIEKGAATYDTTQGALVDFVWVGYLDGGPYFRYEIQRLGYVPPTDIPLIFVAGGVFLVVASIIVYRQVRIDRKSDGLPDMTPPTDDSALM